MSVPRFARSRSLATALAAIAVLAISACSSTTTESDTVTPTVAHVAPHWDYAAEGPDHWAELDKDYLTCQSGHQQSPIDLPGHTRLTPDEHITIDYHPAAGIEVVNNGHTIQANLPADNGNRILIGDVPFDLVQFHFHLPSEHTIDGAGTTMEVHLVHKNSVGKLAVLGVLMQAQPGRSAFEQVLAAAPDQVDGKVALGGDVDPLTFLPADIAQFRYQGSLTTPPCTEGVSWTVLEHPVAVAPAEADKYRALFPQTNRPTQPLNGRTITLAGK